MKNKIIQGILQLIGIMAVGAIIGYAVGKINQNTIENTRLNVTPPNKYNLYLNFPSTYSGALIRH